RGVNSYAALDGGSEGTIAAALAAITCLPTSSFSINPTDVASALAQGRLVVLGTGDSTSDPHVEHNHAYAVVGYNPGADQPVTLFNPWGINGGSDHGNSISGQVSLNAKDLSANFVGGASTGAAPAPGLNGPDIRDFTVVPADLANKDSSVRRDTCSEE